MQSLIDGCSWAKGVRTPKAQLSPSCFTSLPGSFADLCWGSLTHARREYLFECTFEQNLVRRIVQLVIKRLDHAMKLRFLTVHVKSNWCTAHLPTLWRLCQSAKLYSTPTTSTPTATAPFAIVASSVASECPRSDAAARCSASPARRLSSCWSQKRAVRCRGRSSIAIRIAQLPDEGGCALLLGQGVTVPLHLTPHLTAPNCPTNSGRALATVSQTTSKSMS